MIDLEFLTTKPDVIDICKRYWQLNSDGTFKEGKEALLPYGGAIYHMPMLEIVIFHNVIARDTRRRCPICGMPQRITSRAQALAPVTPRPPCDDCRYLKRHLPKAEEQSVDARLGGEDLTGQFTFPIAAMVIFDALSQIAGLGLHEGFAAHDCVGLAPAHINRFIAKLHGAKVIEKVRQSARVGTAPAAATYRLTDDAAFGRDYAVFKSLLADRRIPEQHGLWEVWLDYAVAECIRSIVDLSALHGLPADPEAEELCSVLRYAVGSHGIAHVRSMALLAVRDASALVEHGSSPRGASATVPGNLARHCQAASHVNSRAEPAAKPTAQPPSELGAWFHKWYGIDERTPGPTIVSSILPDPLQDGPVAAK